jgi:hypothetical protein
LLSAAQSIGAADAARLRCPIWCWPPVSSRSLAHEILLLTVAWAVLGVGMAMGLTNPLCDFDRPYGARARPITGITLIAGFASTVGWPLGFLEAQHGWRACLIWAALHIIIGCR